MKSFVALFALVAVAVADVSHLGEAAAQIEEQHSNVEPEGFEYGFRTSNGINAQEAGQLKVISKDEAAVNVQGSNSYTSPEGIVIRTDYIADENGYRPVGDHLPTPPPPQPIPEYIARSIAYIAANPPRP